MDGCEWIGVKVKKEVFYRRIYNKMHILRLYDIIAYNQSQYDWCKFCFVLFFNIP